MAEFVERELEQLLPVFEQLKLTQLMQSGELDDFIKQCRAFEYKCAKQTKRANDFLAYAHFMADQLEAVGRRRQEMKYLHRYDEIERPLKQKCAFLHRICSQRFKKLIYYNEEIAFLHRANMLKACSQAFTRLLQIHGHLADNYMRAARFEFFDNNHSTDSARSILSIGLRKFPKETQLWLTQFDIELHYVKYLLNRRNFFLEKDHKSKRFSKNYAGFELGSSSQDEEHSEEHKVVDDLVELKLVRIVYELAMKNIEDKNEKIKLLRNFLRSCMQECGKFVAEFEKTLRTHLEAMGENPSDIEEENCEIPDEELYSIDTGGMKETENDEEGKERGEEEEAGKEKRRITVLDEFNPDDPELKQLLSKATLTEDYDKRPLEQVLAISSRQQKKQRKAKRERTAGTSWFSMPATEQTDELKNDLEVVQMRDALDPKQHYKKPDREVLPKHFQVGRIVESKAVFYSARLPKKQRKRTLVEELINDHELLARNKKRYTEIVRRREATERGTFQRGGPLPKRSRRKSKKTSH